jgi:glycosyltransferase involved in cell wall biosynthesis
MMQYFLNYYKEFCDKIIIYDNESTDNTLEIIKSCKNAEIRTWNSDNQIDDLKYLQIKENAYKESRGVADWVIICDTDEFIYHPNLLTVLKNYKAQGINFPKTRGYNVIPNCIPDLTDNLPVKYQCGVRYPIFDKRAIFNPMLDIKYEIGCHYSNTPSGAVDSPEADIALMHFKMLNLNYYVYRQYVLGKRLSNYNKQQGWGKEYLYTPEQSKLDYLNFLYRCEQIQFKEVL